MERVEFGVWPPVNLISYPPPYSFFHALRYNLKELNFEEIRDIALKAEKLGYHSLWIPDHLSWEKSIERLDSWTILSALSSRTNKIRLGTRAHLNDK